MFTAPGSSILKQAALCSHKVATCRFEARPSPAVRAVEGEVPSKDPPAHQGQTSPDKPQFCLAKKLGGPKQPLVWSKCKEALQRAATAVKEV